MAIRIWLIVMSGTFFSQPSLFAYQKPMGNLREGHVMIPTMPCSNFEVVQAYLAFGFFEDFFYTVTLPLPLDEFRKRRAWICMSEAIRTLTSIKFLNYNKFLLNPMPWLVFGRLAHCCD